MTFRKSKFLMLCALIVAIYRFLQAGNPKNEVLKPGKFREYPKIDFSEYAGGQNIEFFTKGLTFYRVLQVGNLKTPLF